MGKERRGRTGEKMREGRRKVCLLLNGGLVTPLGGYKLIADTNYFVNKLDAMIVIADVSTRLSIPADGAGLRSGAEHSRYRH